MAVSELKIHIEIKYSNDINVIMERQNLLIKLWQNPHIIKYKEILRKISEKNDKNQKIISGLGSHFIKSTNHVSTVSHIHNLYSGIVFIIILLSVIFMYRTISNSYKDLGFAAYNSVNDNIKTLITNFIPDGIFNEVTSNFIAIYILLYLSISVLNSLWKTVEYRIANYKLNKIVLNTIDILDLSKRIISRNLLKRKGLLHTVANLRKKFNTESSIKILNNIDDLKTIYEYLGYLSFFMNIDMENYFLSNFSVIDVDSINSNLFIKVPKTNFVKQVTKNCMVVDRKYKLVESIVMSQTTGISFIENLHFSIFDKVLQFDTVKLLQDFITDKVKGNLIVIKHTDLNISISEILRICELVDDNYLILII